jgi:hypothetical protein
MLGLLIRLAMKKTEKLADGSTEEFPGLLPIGKWRTSRQSHGGCIMHIDHDFQSGLLRIDPQMIRVSGKAHVGFHIMVADKEPIAHEHAIMSEKRGKSARAQMPGLHDRDRHESLAVIGGVRLQASGQPPALLPRQK